MSGREFLKDRIRRLVDWEQTDQHRGVPPPPLAKPAPPESRRIDLPPIGEWTGIASLDLAEAVAARRSHRRFREESMTLDELSFLIWATQGIRREAGPGTAFRTVPSAGCRHAFETYLCALRVEGLPPGIYRYLPLEHRLLPEGGGENLGDRLTVATLGQRFTGRGAVTFVWTAVPCRMEWLPTRSWPSTRAMSARTFISPARPWGRGPAPSRPTIRKGWTVSSASTGRRSSQSTSPPSARSENGPPGYFPAAMRRRMSIFLRRPVATVARR